MPRTLTEANDNNGPTPSIFGVSVVVVAAIVVVAVIGLVLAILRSTKREPPTPRPPQRTI